MLKSFLFILLLSGSEFGAAAEPSLPGGLRPSLENQCRLRSQHAFIIKQANDSHRVYKIAEISESVEGGELLRFFVQPVSPTELNLLSKKLLPWKCLSLSNISQYSQKLIDQNSILVFKSNKSEADDDLLGIAPLPYHISSSDTYQISFPIEEPYSFYDFQGETPISFNKWSSSVEEMLRQHVKAHSQFKPCKEYPSP